MEELNSQTRTITAFFDDRTSAQKATDDLAAIGVPRGQIRVTEGANPSAEAPQADKGFWEELKEMFMPAEDRYGYAEGLRRGGYLLSAQVDGALYDRALTAIDTEGAVNMDEREASWRASGWTGYQADSSTTTAATAGAAALSPSPAPSARATELETGRDEVIPIYEETAKIGKRDVNHGRVRLRSYVVETPVTEQVNLRNEQVQVERRPVDRAIAAGDAVFQDRVIEAEEHAEEAVIGKETRVKEEISLRKTVENQAKTVSETLRRTEVEVSGRPRWRVARNGSALLGRNRLQPDCGPHGCDRLRRYEDRHRRPPRRRQD